MLTAVGEGDHPITAVVEDSIWVVFILVVVAVVVGNHIVAVEDHIVAAVVAAVAVHIKVGSGIAIS